ncbi:MAG: carboxypeptidase-like regulatory domain-containing protein [Salibacteraceae bacterium]
MKKIILFFFLICTTVGAFAQNEKSSKEVIQFSGVILDGDSLQPVPFTTIIVMQRKTGTTADANGIFSFAAQTGDSIKFTSVGFKDAYFVIPDTLHTSKYSLIQLMSTDTMLLRTHMVYPWPSKEQFKEEFLNTRIPTDDLDRANANLAQAEMRERMQNMPGSGSENFKYENYQRAQQSYYNGQYPSWSILNPIAWAQFIKAWDNGDFKKK